MENLSSKGNIGRRYSKILISKLLVNLEFTTSSLIHFILWKINYIDLWTLE